MRGVLRGGESTAGAGGTIRRTLGTKLARPREYTVDSNPAGIGSWNPLPLPDTANDFAVDTNRVRLLALPTGEIMLTGYYANGAPAFFTPSGTQLDVSAHPRIATLSPLVFGNFWVTGNRLNGTTSGCDFGDDAKLGTNFPITTLLASNGQSWRTFGHNFSQMAPSPTVTTSYQFKPVQQMPAGTYSAVVAVNGLTDVRGGVVLPQPDRGIAWLASQVM